MLERIYTQIVDDWHTLQVVRATLGDTQHRLRAAITQARQLGASGRGISRHTRIPEANVRRWTHPQRSPGQCGNTSRGTHRE